MIRRTVAEHRSISLNDVLCSILSDWVASRKEKLMKIVSFLGKKGGVGKTTNAHAAAHGLGMAGVPAAYVLTDKRELLSDEKRVYTIIDGRTVPQLERAIASARQRDTDGIL